MRCAHCLNPIPLPAPVLDATTDFCSVACEDAALRELHDHFDTLAHAQALQMDEDLTAFRRSMRRTRRAALVA